MTTVLFNQGYKVLHDRFDLKDVAEMTKEDYYVGGCTALLDAMGSAIQKEINVQHNLPDNAKAEKVIFVIITDGHENASCEYSYSDVGKMVEAQKEKGWEFLFLGANMDAVQEARRFGIDGSRAATYRCDDVGTRVVYDSVNKAMCSMRKLHKGKLDDSWKDEIEKDMKTRG